ncbi:MAG TPA: DNA methyltransferase [Ktedonobacteraceae bacterium]|nr:DNA methyltransferase [Ktedonobacteraceae bacterium]
MQESNISTIDETRRRVGMRLQELYEEQSVKPLHDLFTTELNYDYSNMRLNLPDEKSRELVQVNEYPRIIATGGDGDFKVISIRLRGSLSRVNERTLITKLLPNHPYALFIFSDAEQKQWHFVNVKESTSDVKSRLFRRITIGPEEQLRTAIERIAMLDLSTLTGDISKLSVLTIQNSVEQAFDVEAVTRTFFRDYRMAFDILQKDLYKQISDETWAHDYALQLLNRCMFLYFIQRKRWLGDDTEFLKTFWHTYNETKAEHEQDTFVSTWLNTLFFKAFNNQYGVADNHFPARIHDVLMLAPFLNGGLFTQNDLDKREGFVVSDVRFTDIFTLLQRYNFTIAEDSPLDQEVAVDPEMIGTVYESLVNVSTEIDERSDAGIFYTPRTEIDLMCRLTLVDYLTNYLDNEPKHLLYVAVFAVEQEDKDTADQHLQDANLWRRIYDLLNNITMIDPACGSGAFLVGMLAVLDDLLVRAIHALSGKNVDNPYNAYERKKRIIGQSLYGVDVMEWAVHIAELRLWLALIVDAEYTREELHARLEPLLPYFTFKVRCGDSLVQEIGGINLGLKHKQTLSLELKKRVDKLRIQKLDFYNNKPSRELRRKEDVERTERNLFKDILLEQIHIKEEEVKRLRQLIKDVSAEQLSLLDATIAHSSAALPERQKRLAECEEELAQLRSTRDALSSAKMPPFVWDIAFPEILVEGGQGFDIVLGNPPYLRQENIHTPYLKNYSREDNKAYKAKLAHAMYELFPRFFGYTDKYGKQTVTNPINQKSDLYIYFYLLGLSLLNKDGAFCFITSNSWLDVGYGAKLQEFLLKHCHIKLILDNEMRRSFASASVNTVIAHFSPPNEQSEWGLKETARFVMSNVPFEDLLAPGIFEGIESAQARQTHPAYRVFPIKQDALLEDGKVPLVEDDDEEREEVSKRGKKSPLVVAAEPPYTGNKWGGKYLRAPDIYWTILEKSKDKLVRLGDIAEVRFGIKTGANEFFYLDEAKAWQWGIEPEFLVPVIKSPRKCKSILIDARNLQSKLFLCHKSKTELKGTRALEYIIWGESQGFQKRPSCAGRPRWWDLGERRFPSLSFNYLIHTTAKTFYAPDSCYFSDNFQDVIIAPPFTLPLCASLNSTVFQLMVNVAGRSNFGDGLLKIQTYEVSDLLCVHPREIQIDNYQLLASPSWDVLEPSIERRALDTIIFKALNLTQGERDAVYEGVTTLIHARLGKAESMNTSKETRKRVETVRKLTGVWMGVPDVEEGEGVGGLDA